MEASRGGEQLTLREILALARIAPDELLDLPISVIDDGMLVAVTDNLHGSLHVQATLPTYREDGFRGRLLRAAERKAKGLGTTDDVVALEEELKKCRENLGWGQGPGTPYYEEAERELAAARKGAANSDR